MEAGAGRGGGGVAGGRGPKGPGTEDWAEEKVRSQVVAGRYRRAGADRGIRRRRGGRIAENTQKTTLGGDMTLQEMQKKMEWRN